MTKFNRFSRAGLLLTLVASFFAPAARSQIFVSDVLSRSIRQYTTSGSGSVFATGLQGPAGLAFDGSGHLYVAEGNANAVTRFPTVPTPGASETGTPLPNLSLSNPVGLAFDGAGYLYIANFNNNTVTRYSTSDGTSSVFVSASAGLRQPFGLAVSGGFLYVANSSSHTITQFALSDGTTPINFAGVAGTTGHGLNTPWGLAISGGYLYVANNGDATITKFLLPAGGANPIPFGSAGLSIPEGLAFDSGGDLFVANSGN